MPLPADYHMHTPLCRHATGEPSAYAARALELGLTEIGFSDHSPMREDDFDAWRMRLDQLDEYVEKVKLARREHPALTIKLAMEVDYLPGHEPWIKELTARHSWDYLIGSVHYVSDSWDVDNPNKLSEWKNRDPWEVWNVYFERLSMAASSKLFDIIGHADLPKKFNYYPRQDLTPVFDKFLDSAKKADVALELNTAGLRKDCKEIYPSPKFVQMMFDRSIPITFGSDAHAVDEVGKDLELAKELATRIGYREYRTFTQRKMQVRAI